MTPQRENALMLASILGIGEEDASRRLCQSVAITHGDGPSAILAREITDLISRTLAIAKPGELADVEIVIGVEPAGVARVQRVVSFSPARVAISAAGSSVICDSHGLLMAIGACYVVADAIAHAVGLQGIYCAEDPFVVPFGDLGIKPDLLDLPMVLTDAVLIGAGAIGNGFLRALRHMAVSGDLTIADPKKVGLGNPNRCLYFAASSVGHEKATELCERSQGDFGRLKLTPFVGEFTSLVRERTRVTSAIVAVDSRRVRRSVQKDLPFEVLDASTTAADEVVVHSHRQPNNGACLACIYTELPDERGRARDIANSLRVPLSEVLRGRIDGPTAELIASKHPGYAAHELEGRAYDSLFKEMCAQKALSLPSGEQVLAPFAFVSSLAGALLVVELANMHAAIATGKTIPSRYFFTNPWRSPNLRARRNRGRLANCEFCSDPDASQAMQRVWGDRYEKRQSAIPPLPEAVSESGA